VWRFKLVLMLEWVDAKEGPFDCERERKLSDVVP
jgi:hypothetical protein